jgi:hypothetical protein
MMGFTVFNSSYGPRDGLEEDAAPYGVQSETCPRWRGRLGTARIARACATLRVNNIGRI